MAEVNKLSPSARKADTQSVTKRYVPNATSDPKLSPESKGNLPATLLTLFIFLQPTI
jgi:hypothetical protein